MPKMIRRQHSTNGPQKQSPKATPKRSLLHETDLSKTIQLSADLQQEEEQTLLALLMQNEDVFAWSPNDIKGIDRSIIEHKLNVDPKIKPRK